MKTGKYFTKKCQACHYVEHETNILDVIRMKYVLKTYNVNEERHKSTVRRWSQWSGGRVPSMEIKGNGNVQRYVGVEGLEKLATRVRKWLDKTERGRRKDIGISEQPLNIDYQYQDLKNTVEEV